MDSDYLIYRGKCKEMAEAAAAEDASLTVVRGHYLCPIWGEQAHWWTVRQDGTIYDPSALQFPSGGLGEYVPFNGVYECAQCGDEVAESAALYNGNYAYCSSRCVWAHCMG